MATPRQLREARREGARAARARARNPKGRLVSKASGAVAAVTYGTMDRLGVPVDIMGIPWKPIVYVGAALMEAMSRDRTLASAAGGIADATAAVYLYAASSSGEIVAGGRALPGGSRALPPSHRARRTGLVDAAGNPIVSYG